MSTRIPRPDAEGLITNLFARYLPLAGDAAFLQPLWTCVMKFNKSIIYVAWVSTFHRPLSLRRMLAPAPSWGLVIDEYDLRWAAISSLKFCISWEKKMNASWIALKEVQHAFKDIVLKDDFWFSEEPSWCFIQQKNGNTGSAYLAGKAAMDHVRIIFHYISSHLCWGLQYR